MAVSVDTVYQRVLAVANKEQRGYITPQEFNLFANQAQMDIFEQYFYDMNQIIRGPGNQTEYSNHLDILNEKINIFEMIGDCPRIVDGSTRYPAFSLPDVDDLYRLGTVKVSPVFPNVIQDPYFNQADGNNVLLGSSSEVTTWGISDIPAGGSVLHTLSGTGVTGNKLHFDGTDANTKYYAFIELSTSIFDIRKTYRLKFTVSDYVSGKIAVTLSGKYKQDNGVGRTIWCTTPAISANGTYSFTMEANQSYISQFDYFHGPIDDFTKPGALSFHAVDQTGLTASGGTVQLKVDDVSLKEVASEWTFGNNFIAGGNMGVSATLLDGGSQFGSLGFSNTSIFKLGEIYNLRKNKLHTKNYFGEELTGEDSLSFAENFAAGSTYRISMLISGATKGRLALSGHLTSSFDNHYSGITTGDYGDLQLYNFDKNGSDHFVDLYWTQGAAATSLTIEEHDNFDGEISAVSVKSVEDNARSVEVEHVTEQEITYMLGSRINTPITKRPVYSRRNNLLNIHPYTIVDGVSCNYVRKPSKVEWGYSEINGSALYNSSSSQDFELHESEEVNLVIKILKLAGISIEDPQLFNIAAREDIFNIQQEKA